MSTQEISGTFETWDVIGGPKGKTQRRYATVTLPFSVFNKIVETYVFRGSAGPGAAGEQREQDPNHVRKVVLKSMKEGAYTPTPLSCGLHRHHKEKLLIDGDQFALSVDTEAGGRLPLTDGGHRRAAVNLWLSEIDKELEEAASARADGAAPPTKKEKELEELKERLLGAPVTFTLHLDGDTRDDFVNLQAGKKVERAHVQSLLMRKKSKNKEGNELLTEAYELCKMLNKRTDSPFWRIIQFDSAKAALAWNTLCQEGKSDLGYSLVGLAQIGQDYGLDRETLAGLVCRTYQYLLANCSAILEKSGSRAKVLTQPKEGGKKGAASTLIGLAVLVAFRVGKARSARGEVDPAAEEHYKPLIRTVNEKFDKELAGSYSASDKRAYVRDAALSYFRHWNDGKKTKEVRPDEGIPVDLLDLLGWKAYGANKDTDE